jgi:zeaxanthin glucosyltransferase
MSHFGLLCPPATGHLNTMLPLGVELQQRGHEVTLCGILDTKPQTIAAGLGFQAIGESEFPIGIINEKHAQLGKMNGLAALRYTINLIKHEVTVFLQEAPSVIKEAGIEALLVDQVAPEGGTIAEFLDIPFISICSALPLNLENSIPPFFTFFSYNTAWWARLRNTMGSSLLIRMAQPIQKVINEYRQQWKLPLYFHPNEAYSKLAQISQSPAEFEFPREALPKCFHFTGPYHNPAIREPTSFPFEKLTGQPLIYASMGTLQNRLMWIFNNIAEACVGLDAQLVISLGGAISSESLPKLPGSPLVVGYAPQLALLKKATLTITHAGLNTTLESLSHGVPMVAIPITNDQPGVGARIVWSGAGEVVPRTRLSVPRLRSVIKQVMSDESYQNNAFRLQEAIRHAGGVSRAAEIIEQAIATGKPVLSDAL